MLLIDERRISPTTIEAIGHNYGISDTGCMFDQYDRKVCKLLQARMVKPSEQLRALKLCGLRVYLYYLTKGEMTAKAYADWWGMELDRGMRKDFMSGVEDLKVNGFLE